MGNKSIEGIYFGFLLLLPLVFCTTTVDAVLIPRQILLSVFILIVVTVLMLRKVELRFNFKSPLLYALAGFTFLNFISFFYTEIPGETHAAFSKLILLISFFLVTTVLLYNNVIRTSQLVTAIIVFSLITLSLPIFEIIEKTIKGQHLLRQIAIIKGSSANKNLLSSILFLSLPFYFMGLQRGTILRFMSLFGILLSLFVLITIRTRVVLIATFIFLILLVCYKIKQRFSIKKRYLFGSGVAIFLLLLLSYSFYFKDKFEGLQSTDVSQHYVSRILNSKTLESRVEFWKNSMQMSKEHILLGVGLGNWQIQFPKYGLNNFSEYGIVNGEVTLQRPHNDFIWILCETGIFGFLAYLFLFGIIFYQLVALIKNASDSKEKWKYYYILCGLVGYIIISFFDFPYERIEHQVVLLSLFAIAASAYFKKETGTTRNYSSWLFILLLPVCYSFIVTFYRFNGEQHVVKMYAAKFNKDWAEVIYQSKKANSYLYPLDNASMPLSWYEGIAHFNENRPEESQECFEKAYQLTPYNVQVISNLASTYQLNGRMDEAETLFNNALKISSGFDEAKLNLAALYYNKKEYDKAYSTINEVKVTSQNPKYQTYLVTILNQKINAYIKASTDKTVVDRLVKNVTTKEVLLQLFFDAKKNDMDFETYLAKAKF
ncbi:O-antigen ligase family protein [Flavobacterium wongokense]|uniref:O-antigen ligase family protein n=1 Tax=Flavobacterium wongokense TaxID=2910674 RepID=UPI001F2BB4D8|nr:O-antigen ligase family protein [Flavobacterium sp. WG47]MCF6131173.1 O-antigen ligase family protein [Flavobacterium sp. WG47]